MKICSCLFLVYGVALLVSAAVASERESPPDTALTPIRDFDVEVLARLGREIYQHDQLAWKATDIVMAQIGRSRLEKDGARGWIVDTSAKDADLVRFLRKRGNELEVLCDVSFPRAGAPELTVPTDRKLTDRQRLKAQALETAKDHFLKGSLPWCGGNPNSVVSDDPSGKGFLVYLLRAKPSGMEVPIGGHYRFSVSADGQQVDQVDRLFASCLTLNKKDVPNGSKLEVLFTSHVISKTPLETHVFLSLQEQLPFAVITPDSMIWYVDKGHMGVVGQMKDGKVEMRQMPDEKP